MRISLFKITIAVGWIFFLSACTCNSQQLKLSGTRWRLNSLYGQELLENTAITLKITWQGISGSAGCNFYGAKYTTRPNYGINIGEVANTEKACREPEGVMQQEEQYLGALQDGTNYKINGEDLFIMDKQGIILLHYRLLPQFQADPEGLKGKTWRLIYADGIEPDELGAFTLRFDDGALSGTTSCRNYQGTYQTEEDSIHVFKLEMTSEGVCTQKNQLSEGIYTTLLGFIEQYNVSENRLELYTIKNNKMIFEFGS